MSLFLIEQKDGQAYDLKIKTAVINSTNAEELSAELFNILEKNGKEITLDLSELQRIGTEGICKLVLVCKKLKEKDGQLNLKGLSEEILKSIQLLKLDRLFHIL